MPTRINQARDVTPAPEDREESPQVEVPNTPEEEAQRAAFHQRWLAEQSQEVAATDRREQAASLLGMLESGKATSAQIQAALAYLLRQDLGA